MESQTKFITLSNQRSGSSVFQRMLDAHPDIKARQEDMRKKIEPATLDDIFDDHHKAIGFKLQYNQLEQQPWILDDIKKNDIKVIQVVRTNLLETALWFRNHFVGEAEKADVSGGLGVNLVVRGKVRAKIPEVVEYMQKLKTWIEKYHHLSDFVVYYDQFVGPEEGVFYNEGVRKKLLRFLGVRDMRLDSGQRQKSRRGKTEEIVINYKQLIEAIEQSDICRYYK